MNKQADEKGLTLRNETAQDGYEKEHGQSHVMVPIVLPSDIDSPNFPAAITFAHEVQHGADRTTGYRERDPMGIGVFNSKDAPLSPSGIFTPAGLEQRGYRAGNIVGREVYGNAFNPIKDAHINGGGVIRLPEYINR